MRRHNLNPINTKESSVSRRRRTRAMRYLARIVLYTKVDAQCDKLSTVAG